MGLGSDNKKNTTVRLVEEESVWESIRGSTEVEIYNTGHVRMAGDDTGSAKRWSDEKNTTFRFRDKDRVYESSQNNRIGWDLKHRARQGVSGEVVSSPRVVEVAYQGCEVRGGTGSRGEVDQSLAVPLRSCAPARYNFLRAGESRSEGGVMV